MVYGDIDYQAAASIPFFKAMEARNRLSGVDVEVLNQPTRADLYKSLAEADGVIFVGHGGGLGRFANRSDKWNNLSKEDVLAIGEARLLSGRGPFSMVMFGQCNSMAGPSKYEPWRRISNKVAGFTGLTAYAQPPFLGNFVVYDKNGLILGDPNKIEPTNKKKDK